MQKLLANLRNMKKANILLLMVIFFKEISCSPPFPKFHISLEKDQLKKYFGVNHHLEVPDYKLVNIKMKRPHGASRELHRLTQRGQTGPEKEFFVASQSIFGHEVQMQLMRNDHLLAPSFRAIRTGDGDTEHEVSAYGRPLCHYTGVNGSMSMAVSMCEYTINRGLSGILLLPSGGVHIQPVDDDLAELLGLSQAEKKRSQMNNEEEILHLVYKPMKGKRLSVPDEKWEDDRYIPSLPRSEYELDDDDIVKYLDFEDSNEVETDENSKEEGSAKRKTSAETMDSVDGSPRDGASKRKGDGKPLYMELAVFFDEKGYDLFLPHVKSEEKLVDLLLGFVNQMQALYQQPTLNKRLQISLVRLELMKKQPADLPHAEGERDTLLDNFCSYQAKKNPEFDSDPNHWDVALYISGLNFFAMEKGKKNGITMGLAPVGGVCTKRHACVIAEFGTVSDDGRPYPSAGLLSTYIAAHELGHNLGMFHDGPPNNDCPSNGHVMSPSRGTKGETTWSSCSSKVLEKSDKTCLYDVPQGSAGKGRDPTKYEGKPGQVWDAHDQCKVFLRDEDATLLNDTVLSIVCQETLCKTPHRIGYYAAGPALEGTYCGGKKWCRHGECASWGSEKLQVVKGGWSDWNKGKCKAGCIKNSRAVVIDKRYCDNPKPRNTEKTCEGDNIRIHFCDDSKLCKSRTAPADYAKQRCEYFSKYLPEVTPLGTQVKYNEKRQWQSCAVYCKMKSGTWYTPRQEFNDMGIDTFFPDGTWCHNDGRTDYFCQNRLCLPPPVKGRSLNPSSYTPNGRRPEVDVPVLNNAHPKGVNRSPKKLQEYFQYKEGKVPPPLPKPDELGRPKEEDYEIIDYISPHFT